MMHQETKAFIANAEHAIWNRMDMMVDGTIYPPTSLKLIVSDLKDRDKLEDLLLEALPFIEDMAGMPNPYKPGVPQNLATRIKTTLEGK